MFLRHKECNVGGFCFWHHVSSGNLLDGRQAFGQVCVHLEKAKCFRFTCFSLIPYSYSRSDILFLIDKPQLVNRSKTRISYRKSYQMDACLFGQR